MRYVQIYHIKIMTCQICQNHNNPLITTNADIEPLYFFILYFVKFWMY